MGCLCVKENEPERKKYSSQDKKKLAPTEYTYTIKDTIIQIKIGDITKEKSQLMISGTDNFGKNRSSSFSDI
jgi:hypothetical protein